MQLEILYYAFVMDDYEVVETVSVIPLQPAVISCEFIGGGCWVFSPIKSRYQFCGHVTHMTASDWLNVIMIVYYCLNK
jgi:hypothetical protein